MTSRHQDGLAWLTRHGTASPARRLMLFVMGIACFVRGYAYAFYEGAGGPSPSGGAVVTLGGTFTLTGVGIAWISIGVVAVYSTLRARWRWATAGIGGMYLLWGVAYLTSALGLTDGNDTDWIPASTYLTTALFVWGSSRLVDVPTYVELVRHDRGGGEDVHRWIGPPS